MRIVMAGPLPPSVGGMTSVIQSIVSAPDASSVDILLFDTRKRTPVGRSLTLAVWTRFDMWRLWRRAIRGGDTIAHIHTCSGLSFFLDAAYVVLARVVGVPVLMHVHGARFDEFLDGLPAPLRYLAHMTARACSRVIVLSEEWQTRLQPRLPGARLVVLGNGVRITALARPEPSDERVVALFLGNLGERKGVWDLLQAAVAGSQNWRLVLVGGDEDPGASQRVDEFIRSRGLGGSVSRVGPVQGDAKYDWLAQADLFVLPSRAEGLPVAMLEAMAAGLPVVVTPVGAIPSVVQHDVTGVVIPAGDVNALLSAIERLVDRPALRQRLGEAGRKVCEERFGIDTVVRRLIALYCEVAAERGASPRRTAKSVY